MDVWRQDMSHYFKYMSLHVSGLLPLVIRTSYPVVYFDYTWTHGEMCAGVMVQGLPRRLTKQAGTGTPRVCWDWDWEEEKKKTGLSHRLPELSWREAGETTVKNCLELPFILFKHWCIRFTLNNLNQGRERNPIDHPPLNSRHYSIPRIQVDY